VASSSTKSSNTSDRSSNFGLKKTFERQSEIKTKTAKITQKRPTSNKKQSKKHKKGAHAQNEFSDGRTIEAFSAGERQTRGWIGVAPT